jgi:hypothetical protein
MLPPGGRNRQLISPHYDKSTASFCHQVAAWVSDMFCNFYLVKNHKIANNSTTNKARLKISTYLESLEFQKCIEVYLTKFKNNQGLHNKISQRFLLTTKLFIYWVKEPNSFDYANRIF